MRRIAKESISTQVIPCGDPFFYALGAFLMTLGTEALVFEQADLNPDAKLPKILQRLRNSNAPAGYNYPAENYAFSQGGQNSAQPFSGSLPQLQTNGQNPGIANSASSAFGGQSRYGPSRFAGPAAGGYGGPRISANSPINQTSSQAFPGQLAGYGGSRTADPRSSPRPQISGETRTIVTKDWMPWSLIAVGGVIFFYTHNSGRG